MTYCMTFDIWQITSDIWYTSMTYGIWHKTFNILHLYSTFQYTVLWLYCTLAVIPFPLRILPAWLTLCNKLSAFTQDPNPPSVLQKLTRFRIHTALFLHRIFTNKVIQMKSKNTLHTFFILILFSKIFLLSISQFCGS